MISNYFVIWFMFSFKFLAYIECLSFNLKSCFFISLNKSHFLMLLYDETGGVMSDH